MENMETMEAQQRAFAPSRKLQRQQHPNFREVEKSARHSRFSAGHRLLTWRALCTVQGPVQVREPLTGVVIGCAIEVHTALGPGLLESACDGCFGHELTLRGIQFVRQTPLPVVYKGFQVDCAYRIDFLIENRLLVELKAVEHVLPIHHAQILTYLRLMGVKQGLLINFNVKHLEELPNVTVRSRRISMVSMFSMVHPLGVVSSWAARRG